MAYVTTKLKKPVLYLRHCWISPHDYLVMRISVGANKLVNIL
jgi:hypothetical protein